MWLLPGTAHAVPFTSMCAAGTVVPMPIDTGSGSLLFERDLNAAGIANNVNSLPLVLHANWKVGQVDLHFTSFQLESGYDKLWVTEHFSDTWEDQVFTGNMGAFTASVNPGNWDKYGVELVTVTDYSVNSTGFTMDTATVQSCRPPIVLDAAQLTPSRHNGGLLLGTSDTVYFQAAAAGAGKKLNVAMWSDVPGVDFDLFARCNAYPTTDQWDYRGYSGDAQEFLSMDSSRCGPGGTWYIAVNSYSGKGMFHLTSGVSFASQELTVRVTTEQNESAATIDAIADTMLRGMRVLYGMTEGGFLVNQIQVCNKPVNGTCPGSPSVVFKRSCTRSFASGGVISMCLPQWTDPLVVAHEAGHAYLALPDEYQDVNGGSQAQCGHTMMSMIAWWMNNLCKGGNHTKDPLWGAPAMSGIGNGWTALVNAGKVPAETNAPWAVDSHGYQSFDFNGYTYTTITY